MHKFSFASKKIRLSFPGAEFEITLDGLVRSRAVNIADWMRAEASRIADEYKNAKAEEYEKAFKDVTKELFVRIDALLGKGAHEKILGARFGSTVMCLYADTCDVMGYILGRIAEEWDSMRGIAKAEK